MLGETQSDISGLGTPIITQHTFPAVGIILFRNVAEAYKDHFCFRSFSNAFNTQL